VIRQRGLVRMAAGADGCVGVIWRFAAPLVNLPVPVDNRRPMSGRASARREQREAAAALQ
jgi:hypothetical protein